MTGHEGLPARGCAAETADSRRRRPVGEQSLPRRGGRAPATGHRRTAGSGIHRPTVGGPAKTRPCPRATDLLDVFSDARGGPVLSGPRARCPSDEVSLRRPRVHRVRSGTSRAVGPMDTRSMWRPADRLRVRRPRRAVRGGKPPIAELFTWSVVAPSPARCESAVRDPGGAWPARSSTELSAQRLCCGLL
jgi:hypothetical protein